MCLLEVSSFDLHDQTIPATVTQLYLWPAHNAFHHQSFILGNPAVRLLLDEPDSLFQWSDADDRNHFQTKTLSDLLNGLSRLVVVADQNIEEDLLQIIIQTLCLLSREGRIGLPVWLFVQLVYSGRLLYLSTFYFVPSLTCQRFKSSRV